MTDYKAIAAEIRQKILDGTITEEDHNKALDIYDSAREIWDKHTWLRALGGWVAEIDQYAVEFLRREIASDDMEDALRRMEASKQKLIELAHHQ